MVLFIRRTRLDLPFCITDSFKVISCADLKGTIKEQLQHDVISGDFDVGYIHSRSKCDLGEK